METQSIATDREETSAACIGALFFLSHAPAGPQMSYDDIGKSIYPHSRGGRQGAAISGIANGCMNPTIEPYRRLAQLCRRHGYPDLIEHFAGGDVVILSAPDGLDGEILDEIGELVEGTGEAHRFWHVCKRSALMAADRAATAALRMRMEIRQKMVA